MKRAHIKIVIVLVAGSFLWGSQVFGDEAKQLADIQSLITALRNSISQYYKGVDKEQTSLLRKQEDIIKKIVSCGDPAIPLLISAIKQEKDPNIGIYFASVLAKIPGEESGKTLVVLYRNEPELRNIIEAALVERAENVLSLGSALSKDEIQVLDTIFEEGSPLTIKNAAQLLSGYKNYDSIPAIKALLKHYLYLIKNPPRISNVFPNHLPEPTHDISLLCKAFSFWGERALPIVQEEKKHTEDKEIQKWLDVILGYCGDRDAGTTLAEMVKDTTNFHECYIAISAYATLMKQEAIPLLQKIIDNKPDYNENILYYHLSGKANDAIRSINSPRLQEEKKRLQKK